MKIPFRRYLAPRVCLIAAGMMTATAILGMYKITNETPMKITIPTPKAPQLSSLDLIGPIAHRVGVNEALVKSIIKAESSFNPAAVSGKGALGLMQVMPATAQEMGLDASEPVQNLEAGTRYIKWLLARYSGKKNGMAKAIAAYNAGPGAVDKHHGIPRYRETRTYVARVLKYFKSYMRST